MTNKIAPYNDEATMQIINKWWAETFPDNRANSMSVIDLLDSYEAFTGTSPRDINWINPNQFAKCLVAAKIADAGGRWAKLENWEPKPYEIARAKVY